MIKTRKIHVALMALILAVILILGMFAGCNKAVDNTDDEKESKQATAQPTEDKKIEETDKEDESPEDVSALPIVDEPLTLTYWVILSGQANKAISSFDETLCYQELEKRTGIDLEFIHPPIGEKSGQSFNLLLASGDLPDMIQTKGAFGTANGFPLQPDQAIKEGILISLNELVDQYAANFKGIIDNDKELKKAVTTDAGTIYGFPKVYLINDPPYLGPIVRKDWLEELGIDVPETVDDWTAMLTTFKEQKGAEVPFSFRYKGWDMIKHSGFLIGAYGTTTNFYQVDDTVKYGFIEPVIKDYLTLMNDWYTKGLINKDFAVDNTNTINALCTTGQSGAWLGAKGNSFDAYLQLMEKENPDYKLTGVPYPSLIQGDAVHFVMDDTRVRGSYTCVTAQSEHPVEAVRLLDYFYSEEGSKLMQYGIEGETYSVTNGKALVLDAVKNGIEGIPYVNYRWKFFLNNGPYLFQSEPVIDRAEITEAVGIWTQAKPDYNMPKITLTAEESSIESEIMSEINTYVSEMYLKFIMGLEPIDNFDSFVEQLKSMNIDEAIAIRQTALDRYNKR